MGQLADPVKELGLLDVFAAGVFEVGFTAGDGGHEGEGSMTRRWPIDTDF